MKQNSSNGSDKPLSKLYPIILSEHNPLWKDAYLLQKAFLENIVGIENIVRVSHYGSTSVPGLIAKPTIDILLELKEGTNLNAFISKMEDHECICLKHPDNPPPHITFLRGYAPSGFKGQAVHIHVRYSGDWDELYFRDYLIRHPDIAKKYGELKLQLKEQFEFDRDGYTAAKGAFISAYTTLAKQEFALKYLPGGAKMPEIDI